MGRVVYGVIVGVTVWLGLAYGAPVIWAAGDDPVTRGNGVALCLTFALLGLVNGESIVVAEIEFRLAKQKYEQETGRKWREKDK